MWKRLFVALLSLHLLVVAVAAMWFLTLPRVGAPSPAPVMAPINDTSAGIQVSVGDEAANAFLAQALSNQPDIRRILDSAAVHFSDTWNADVGIKVNRQVVPFHITFLPSISNGNLDLQIVQATMATTTMTDTLVNMIQLLPLPGWITFDAATETLHINLSAIPTRQVRVQPLSYSAQTRKLTVLVSPTAAS